MGVVLPSAYLNSCALAPYFDLTMLISSNSYRCFQSCLSVTLNSLTPFSYQIVRSSQLFLLSFSPSHTAALEKHKEPCGSVKENGPQRA